MGFKKNIDAGDRNLGQRLKVSYVDSYTTSIIHANTNNIASLCSFATEIMRTTVSDI